MIHIWFVALAIGVQEVSDIYRAIGKANDSR